jgi:hypothetical protein
MKYTAKSDIADPLLYRTYWKLVLGDILFHLGYEATAANKELLHDFHKRVLLYDSTAGRTQEVMSRFITDVTIFWAVEYGIFVRTSKKQPLYIETMDLHDLWDIL